MNTPASSELSERRRGLTAVTVALAVVSLIHGLTLPMFGLVLADHGVEKSLIGLNTAAQYLAVFAAAPFVNRLMRTVGPAVLMFWSIVVAGAVFLVLPLKVDFYLWLVLRFILGTAQSFLWIAGEAWVSQLAEDHRRGRVVAIFGAVTAAGFASGPLLLSLVGTDGWLPFVIAGGLTLSGVAPLALVMRSSVRLAGQASGSFFRYAMVTPVATAVYFGFAACDAVLLTFLPIYAVQLGAPEWVGITLLSAMAVGAIVSQYPVGGLADRLDGMTLAIGVLLLSIAVLATVPMLIGSTPLNFGWLFLVGCVLGAMYTLPLVFIGRRFRGAELGAAVTVRSIVFCLGSMVGPPIVGAAMQWFGPNGLPLSLAIMFTLILPLAIVGRRRRWVA